MKVVAIGTVADVAKLTGENRTIVSIGLKDLARAANPGLKALIDVAGCGDGKGMTAYDLGFRLGPRINAAGRMDAARAVVELFDTRDSGEARRLAEHLDARNKERKTVQQQIVRRDNVFNLEVYATLKHSEVIEEGHTILVFTSPSNVEAFFEKNRISAGQKVVAMGDATGAALQKMKVKNFLLPKSFGDLGLVQAVLALSA
jgi:single-stranded DNA-specific DHH superfamily exonuclease